MLKVKSPLRLFSPLVIPLIVFFILGISSRVFAENSIKDKDIGQDVKVAGVIASLSGGNLRSCQSGEASIKKRTTSLVNLVENMESKFTSIAGRVENYYITKLVPAGKTVANYDTLVADIAVKKAAVSTLLTSAQNDVASFSCTSNDPKGDMAKFRVDMQNVKKALKDYRTSIKSLIVAVRTVNGEKVEEVSPTLTPTP